MPPSASRNGPSASGEPRQCWECLRRRWVCDAARPVCNKCRAAGIVCPGYNDTKPLTWLAPGRVTSRARRNTKRNSISDLYVTGPVQSGEIEASSGGAKSRRRSSAASTGAGRDTKRPKTAKSEDISIKMEEDSTDQKSRRSSAASRRRSSGIPTPLPTGSDPSFLHVVDAEMPPGFLGIEPPKQLPPLTNDLKSLSVELTEAIQYYNSNIYPTMLCSQLAPNPFVVPIMAMPQVPSSMTHALISMSLSHKLLQLPEHQRGSYPWREEIPEMPKSTFEAAVPDVELQGNEAKPCVMTPQTTTPTSPSTATDVTGASSATATTNGTADSLGSTLLNAGEDLDSMWYGYAKVESIPELKEIKEARVTPTSWPDSSVADLLLRLHHHTGRAIRCLTEEISKESTRSSDATIASVIVLMIAEVQQSVSPHWRPHVNGLMALIMLRGGMSRLMRSSKPLRPILLSFVIVAVVANTTSPPSDQNTATTHLGMIDLVSELYSIGVFPSLPCPMPLFLGIIQINHLRYQATGKASPDQQTPFMQLSPRMVLERIDSFEPEAWLKSARNSPYPDEWLLIARIFQSAVILYCLSSLATCLVLDTSPCSATVDLETARSLHRARLFTLLGSAMQSPITRKCMIWPTVVAGIEAASGTLEEQQFVELQLSDMSRDTCASYPLVAKEMLGRFWASRKTGWDDCFDQPYAILI